MSYFPLQSQSFRAPTTRKASIFLLALLLYCYHATANKSDCSNTAPSTQPKIDFDLPVMPLNDALIEVAIIAKINIVFRFTEAAQHNTQQLKGSFTPLCAISTLTQGTPFTYKNKGNIIVVIDANKNTTKHKAHVREKKIQLKTEEVYVVSARHQQETLQDVPMSLTTHSESWLQERAVNDLVELSSFIANANFYLVRGTSSVLATYIRGLGHSNPIAGIETGVGTYIDDVFFNRPLSVLLDVYNTERIEVLRGPQGTLYGRNTVGGAIKYLSKPLADELNIDITGTLGTYRQRDLIVTWSSPLTNHIKIGGSVASLNRAGFGTNLVTNEEHYDKKVHAFRLSSLLEPTDNLSFTMTFDSAEDSSSPKSGYRIYRNNTDSMPLSHIFDTQAGISLFGHPVDKNRLSTKGVSLKTQLNFHSGNELVLISARRKDDGMLPTDIDSTEERTAELYPIFDNQQTSHELRFHSTKDRLTTIAGLYYLDAQSSNAIDYVTEPGVIYFTYNQSNTESWSAFSSVDIMLSQTTSATLGIRYTNEDRHATIIRQVYVPSSSNRWVSPHFGGDSIEALTTPPVFDTQGRQVWPKFTGSRSDESFTPKATLSWQPNTSLHSYASYATGFKGGGFAPKGVFTDQRLRQGFKPETVKSYELGLKFLSPENHWRIFSSVFKSEHKNIHVEAPVRVDLTGDGNIDGEAIVTTNAERATVYGGEVEISIAPHEYWHIDLSIGIVHAAFKRFTSEAGNDVSDQREFISTPKNTIALATGYAIPVTNGTLSFNAGINYQSETTLFNAPSNDVDQGGFSLIKAGVTWTSFTEKWRININGENIGNKQYFTSAFYESPNTELFATGDLTTVFFGNPRTITATLQYSF